MGKKNRLQPRKPKDTVGGTDVETPEDKARREMPERMTQLMALRKQISDKIGNIYHEIPEFEADAGAWVRDGVPRSGSKVLSVVPRRVEWAFYDNIRKFPEICLKVI